MSNEYPYASMRDSFDLSAYFVVGPEDCKGRPLTDVVDQALHGGATFIQLRAKEADASELTDMARDIAQIIEDNEKSDSVAFVIDDRADVVWQARRKGIKVDGVHIGQTDMEPREARALLGDEAIVGLSAETESLVRLINELPDGCIDYIGAGPLHVSTTKPEASVGGNDGSGKTLDAAQINTICVASEFPVVVGGGVTAADMAMLADTKAAGWFVVSAIAGAENPEEAARTMVEGWKAVRGDKKHGYAPRVVTHTPATDTQATQEGAAKPGSEATEKKFTNAKDAKDAQKLAKQQRVDIAARGSKQRDKAHSPQDQVRTVHLSVWFLRPGSAVHRNQAERHARRGPEPAVPRLQHRRPQVRPEGRLEAPASRLDPRPRRHRRLRGPPPQP